MLRKRNARADFGAGFADDLPFIGGVAGKDIDADDDGQAKGLEIFDMLEEVGQTGLQGGDVRLAQFRHLDAPLIL